VAAVAAAAVAALASTFILYRSEELGMEGGVVIAPFAVIAMYAAVDPLSVALHLLRSLAFPLVATALWPRAALRDMPMRMAWGATGVGLVISYVLAESGTRFDHGNFLWTGQMAVFVLFVAAAAFARGRLQLRSESSLMFGRAIALGVILLFHVEAGLRHVAHKLETTQWLAYWM
jgi:hypothetical protein